MACSYLLSIIKNTVVREMSLGNSYHKECTWMYRDVTGRITVTLGITVMYRWFFYASEGIFLAFSLSISYILRWDINIPLVKQLIF